MSDESVPSEIKALEPIQKIRGHTKAARLRTIMPQIEAKIREGAGYQDIVDALNESGFDITLKTFKNYLYRYRKKMREREGDKTQGETLPPPAGGSGNRKPNLGVEPLESDGNPAPKVDAEGEKEAESSPSLDDILDARRRDSDGSTEQYFSRPRPLNLRRSKKDDESS